MTLSIDQLRLFTEKAQAVSAQVRVVADRQAVFAYAVELCEQRRKEKTAAATENDDKQFSSVAAPALNKEDLDLLTHL